VTIFHRAAWLRNRCLALGKVVSERSLDVTRLAGAACLLIGVALLQGGR
jgi:hydrogenase/urease accessory protein HupE